MARPLRIEYPGAIYHVTSRMIGNKGDGRDKLFRDQRDFVRFVERLGERVKEYGIRLYLFCLMGNHFHLMLETPEGNLSRFMQSLSTAYTVYYNLRHKRHGHLLDGRFKAKVVSGDDYLLKLSRYVHQNPVWVSAWKDKPLEDRIRHLRQYRWSSYPGYIGLSKQWPFVDESPVLAMMAGGQRAKRRAYREIVETGLAASDEEFKAALRASPTGVGDEDFLQWVEKRRAAKIKSRNRPEDVSFRRRIQPLDVELVLSILCEVFGVERSEFLKRRQNSHLRAVVAKVLMTYSGLTQREVAKVLAVRTGAAVCRQIRRWPEHLSKHPTLASQVREIETRLDAVRERMGMGRIK